MADDARCLATPKNKTLEIKALGVFMMCIILCAFVCKIMCKDDSSPSFRFVQDSSDGVSDPWLHDEEVGSNLSDPESKVIGCSLYTLEATYRLLRGLNLSYTA